MTNKHIAWNELLNYACDRETVEKMKDTVAEDFLLLERVKASNRNIPYIRNKLIEVHKYLNDYLDATEKK